MHAIKIHGRVGPDGVLKLEVQLGAANQDVEAILVVEFPRTLPDLDANGYPFNFFARLAAMPGEMLDERPEQGMCPCKHAS
jgi:hypothetical protein